jgi:hypothetical protein
MICDNLTVKDACNEIRMMGYALAVLEKVAFDIGMEKDLKAVSVMCEGMRTILSGLRRDAESLGDVLEDKL